MLKKFNWRAYMGGFALLVALFILFMSLFLRVNPPPYRPAVLESMVEASPAHFQFAFLADVHHNWGVFTPILKEIVVNGYSFAVVGGDMVPKNKEDLYIFFFRELAKVKWQPPLYFVPGNHEVHNFEVDIPYSLENFHSYCGPDQYWFSRGNTALLIINDANITLTNEQFHWLEDTLRMVKKNFTHIVVFMHVPPFDPRGGSSYCLPKNEGEKFLALMEKYGVDYVFCGHIHCYFKKVIHGVTYIISGGAGGGLKCPDGFYHYVRVSVRGTKMEDSVIKIKQDIWLKILGDVKYYLCIRRPFLIPILTLVMGQSLCYFFTL